MSYRKLPRFDTPTAEDVQRSRRTLIWIMPLVIIQQGFAIFGASDPFSGTVSMLAWAAVSLTILSMLIGMRYRWLSDRDNALLNDEWHRETSADAMRWGVIALVVIGIGLAGLHRWRPLDAGVAVYALVNSVLLIASVRYAWLNRREPDEDE
ncbi:hypothetical protein ABDK56_07770 [Sphingomonas sp. ASV193]|uniref:hypothetical protein n=1 Tax=Sphingomonas sp. ASV193 TaxID=3144405 RepID=UPI0032E8CAC3